MKKQSYEMFKNSTLDEIVNVLDEELQKRNESPIWKLKVVPFSRAVLSVLIPLRDEKMLFTPEGDVADELTPELFFRWCDFVSLKTLAFTIEKSNEAKKLLRTKVDDATCQRYKNIDLEEEILCPGLECGLSLYKCPKANDMGIFISVCDNNAVITPSSNSTIP